MKRLAAVTTVIIGLLFTTGCATPQRVGNTPSGTGTQQAGMQVETTNQVNPKLYATCNAIYRGVQQALAQNRNESFDTELESVQAIGSSAAPNSPNGVLFADAQQVVALCDAYTGEGAPAKAYNELQASLKTLKQALDQYRPMLPRS
ncbi:hypothetical protein IW967_13285 [Alicyclobacillus mali]|uniref:Lipoprotein n=1 Tax=Alicyclobacillus mali (ex Roth et al. 2021) TaxID=1123961 RepID=A0ABS0F694_9BACL|nr:hypothetical protein [Alicyclobacillus mali (ex Roth et al. 2021)]MBF8378824.1 hypothetical protein [Alicyclobacillus mali (ex Roth et al. 2021)]MCL6489713.1 hypothetical protein [Alicyclobacillus mali (ex Roth et al. 2021)]